MPGKSAFPLLGIAAGVSLLLLLPALRRMSPACGSAGPVAVAWRCHRDGRCREGVFPPAPRKRGALTVPSIVHTALERLHLYPVSKGQPSRAGAWSPLPLCRVWYDSQPPSQAGAALAWGVLLLFIFWCVKLNEKLLGLGSDFVFPVFPSSFSFFPSLP